MKFETYLYIDRYGDIVEATKDPASSSTKFKAVCLKITADIPDEHFEVPIYGIDVTLPSTGSSNGTGVQNWLTPETKQLDYKKEVKTSKAEKAQRMRDFDEDVPF